MKNIKWYSIVFIIFISISVIFYLIQIIIFHNTHETFFLFFQDLSFVPLDVLLVTFFLDRLMKRREKQSFLNKLNMVIGVFFNNIGLEFIRTCGNTVLGIDEIGKGLQISVNWTDKDFLNVKKYLALSPGHINPDKDNLEILKDFLKTKQDGLLSLLANPNLLEHDGFTELLWAVFHLADELAHRENFTDLPKTDTDHLKVDIHRAYRLVIIEWVSYMKHLKKDYPYLFSVAVRTNPFNPDADIIVK